jgi:hypothetical protein
MPHKRTPEGKQKQAERAKNLELRKKQIVAVKRYVYSTSFHDKLIQEIVCTQTPEQIDRHLQTTFMLGEPQMVFPLNEVYRDGLVLASSLTFTLQ